MKIILDKTKYIAKLINREGKIISEYPYKKIKTDTFTYEDFEKNINEFNEYLEKQPEFDNIKDLLPYVNLFDFN